MGTGDWGVELEIHLKIVLRLGKRGSTHSNSYTPYWRSSYLVTDRDNFISLPFTIFVTYLVLLNLMEHIKE
jgi:hypothetical protein